MGKSALPRPTLQQIVDRARILVIDDQDFPYQTLFKRDGYNVTEMAGCNQADGD